MKTDESRIKAPPGFTIYQTQSTNSHYFTDLSVVLGLDDKCALNLGVVLYGVTHYKEIIDKVL